MIHCTFKRYMMLASVAAILVQPLCVRAADPVKISGSTSLEKLIKPKAADIQAKSGMAFATVANGSGRGVDDLVSGRSDIAMIGGPLAVIAESLNAKKPGSVKAEELTATQVGSEGIAFIVNPANKVETLTSDQLRDIFSGKTTNWKDVGGADGPIMVVAPPTSDGIRATLSGDLMNGAAFAKETRVVNTGPDVNKIVGQVPQAISFLSTANKTDAVKVLKADKEFAAKLCLVTKGAPTDAQKTLIEAIQAAISK